jgi:hypothetical protein
MADDPVGREDPPWAERPTWRDQPETQRPDGTRPPPPMASSMVRFAAADRGSALLVLAVAVFVAAAIIKPWPSGGAPQPAHHRVATAPPTAEPTIDPLAGIRNDCQDPAGWRIFSRERWSGGVLRSWRTLDPVQNATGPLDPAIPVIPIGPEIVALGFCATWTGPDRPPDGATIQAWRLPPAIGTSATVAVPIDLTAVIATLRPPFGGLYAPPDAPVNARDPEGSAVWNAGTYVFALRGSAFGRWWAVGILEDTRPAPSVNR